MALDREKTLQSAQTFLDQRRFDRALAEYRKVVEADPNDARTLLKIGDIQARSEEYTQAIETYDRVAEFYSQQGFALKAIAVYKQVRELIVRFAPQVAGQYTHVVDRLVTNYVELGLVNDALSTLDEEANRLRQANLEDEAVQVFRRMTEVGDRAPIAHLRLAEGLCRVNEIDAALDSFWAAAQLLIEGGRADDALRVVERMLHFKQSPAYAKLAARLYLQKETQAEGMVALSRLQVCFQADPRDLETLELLAEAFRVIGQAPKSLEVKKEIARQAYDQNDAELFVATLTSLKSLAPDDDQVKALAQLKPPTGARRGSGAPSQGSGRAGSARPGSGRPSSQPAAPLQADYIASSIPPIPPGAHSAQLEELGQLEPLDSDPSAIQSTAVPQPPRNAIDSEDLADVRAHTHKALIDAQTFRDLNLFEKAIETIQVALEFDPRSIELREALRDLFAEAGDREGALEEMLTMAAIYVEYDRADHASTVLINILEAEPGHAVARQMLDQLGYGASQETSSELDAISDDYGGAAPVSPRPSTRPTPSESMDAFTDPDSHPLRALAERHVPPSSRRPPPSHRPPMARQSSRHPAQPLPSIASSELQSAPPASRPSYPSGSSLPSFEVEENYRDTQTIEEALEEAEFFAARGMKEDARILLEDHLLQNPGHPLLLEALADLDGGDEDEAAPRPPMESDFDLHASLGELERAVRESQNPPEAGPTVDVETVFEKFKAGVKHRVAENDSATHFDLGVAYKEMNLLDDAIVELELAARDPSRECTCRMLVGQIYGENELWPKAHTSFAQALRAPEKTYAQETALYYELGHVSEMSGQGEQAIQYFEQVLQRDPEYRDTRARLEAARDLQLRSMRPKAAGDDDLDRAFDELLGGD